MKVWRDLHTLPRFQQTVITIGTFDGVHKGHRKLIDRIVQLSRNQHAESVLISFHPHPRMVLQPDAAGIQLLNTIDEKVSLLETCGIDHLVLVPFSREFSNMNAADYVQHFLVACFHPQTIVIGYDHRFGQNRSGGINLLKQLQTELRYSIDEIPKETLDDIDISSTKIRNALMDGDIVLANGLLGYPYFMNGVVVKGQQNGRKLGFPTANIELNDTAKLVPANGVYAARVTCKDHVYASACNIGMRPTLNGKQQSIEAHLLGFEGDLYGEHLKLELLQYLRTEKKFASLTELQAAIAHDVERVKNMLE